LDFQNWTGIRELFSKILKLEIGYLIINALKENKSLDILQNEYR